MGRHHAAMAADKSKAVAGVLKFDALLFGLLLNMLADGVFAGAVRHRAIGARLGRKFI